MSADVQPSLARSSMNALKWNYLGVMVRTVSSLVIGIMLARILGPEPFGQVAVATLFIGFANLVADFGFGSALVQRKTITEQDIRFVFTMQLLTGLALSGLMAGTSGLIATVFHSTGVSNVIRVLSPIFALQALGQTSASLLKRDMAFKKLQTASVSSYLVSYLAIGIPLALLGAGVWSLVVVQLCQTIFFSVQVYMCARHPLKPMFHSSAVGFVGYGTKVVATNIVNWTISNLDNVIAGRAFGITALGLYSRMFVLTSTPMNGIVTTLQSVLFPAASRSQHNVPAIRKTYLAATVIVGLLTFPAFCGVAAIGDTFISGLFGGGWRDAIPLLAPLALAMPIHAMLALPGPLLWGMGLVERELKAQIVAAIVSITALLVASRFSLVVLAWSVFGIYLVRWILMARTANDVLDVGWREFVDAAKRPVVTSAFTTAAILLNDTWLRHVGVGAGPRLIGDMIAGIISLSALISIAPRHCLGEPGLWCLQRFSGHMPPLVSKIVWARLGEVRA